MKKALDYHAILTIYNQSDMDKRTLKRLAKWLLVQADSVEDVTMQKIGYAKRFSARLMK